MWLLWIGVGVGAVEQLGRCDGSQQQLADCGNSQCHKEKCRDCAWKKWTEWSSCTCEGLKERHRTIGAPNNECGNPCNGTRVETAYCMPDCVKAPVDCELEDWGKTTWSDCTKTCGGGQTTRQRKIKTQPKNGGKLCDGELSNTKPCNTEPCEKPMDCSLSTWSDWRKCSVTCGVGQQDRQRQIAVQPKAGGKSCKGGLSEVRSCGDKLCEHARDCDWGAWVDWSACSRSCGGGERTRSRMIIVAPRGGGKLCDPLVSGEVGACKTDPCARVQDCEFTEWTAWDGCSCTCKGIQNRARHIKHYPVAGGKTCEGNLKELRPCNVDNCKTTPEKEHTEDKPVDCKIGPWADWQKCSLTCGSGIRHRVREVVQNPKHGGKSCEGTLHEVSSCDNPKCEQKTTSTTSTTTTTPDIDEGIDCKWSNWEQWSSCSVSCGGGEKYRQRQVVVMPEGRGSPCAHLASLETVPCSEQLCDCTDCQWGEWSEWGTCACTGLEERQRTIGTHAKNGCGVPCTGPKVESRQCKPQCEKAMQDCTFSAWLAWGECTQPCGGGQRERTRSVTHEASMGGKACSGVVHEIEPCNADVCHPPMDCVMGSWNDWSSCTSKCEGGEQYRHRNIASESAYSGKACDEEMVLVRACNTDIPCSDSVDCVWDTWGSWSACSLSCGGGYHTRDRNIKHAPRHAGKLCEAKSKMEVEACNMQSCHPPVVDAMWGSWSSRSDCSVTCGQGFTVRSRTIKIKGGAESKRLSGPFQEYQTCNMKSCLEGALDCKFSDWSAFGDCSCSCNGIRDRSRRITQVPQQGGKSCAGHIIEVEPCNIHKCQNHEKPKDCEFGDWSDWGSCSALCDGGSRDRERRILSDATGGGDPCSGPLRTLEPCNTKSCREAVDCKWGKWSDWSDCSVECGGGEHNRFRHILTMSKGVGKPCEIGDTAQTTPCNEHACGELQFCIWGPWSEWDQCSTSCGPGEKERNRLLTVTTKKKDVDVLASGILESMLPYDGEQMTNAQVVSVFSFGMLFAAILWVAIQPRRLPRQEPLLADVPAE